MGIDLYPWAEIRNRGSDLSVLRIVKTDFQEMKEPFFSQGRFTGDPLPDSAEKVRYLIRFEGRKKDPFANARFGSPYYARRVDVKFDVRFDLECGVVLVIFRDKYPFAAGRRSHNHFGYHDEDNDQGHALPSLKMEFQGQEEIHAVKIDLSLARRVEEIALRRILADIQGLDFEIMREIQVAIPKGTLAC